MDQITKVKKFKKINPNEYCGLLYDQKEIDEIVRVLLHKKIFRYATRKISTTDQFENQVKKYMKVDYALGLNNGTSALKTALYAVGVKKGDRVLISAVTFIATAAAVISLGATPIPIDFDFTTGMNLDDLKKEVEKGCKAIIPVHLQGRTFNLEPILSLAKDHKIIVIEDACQAFASKLGNKCAGTFADIGVFSFQQYKQVSVGEGGMLVTNNEEYYRIAGRYSDHGMVRESMSWDDDKAMIGDNYRMSNLQAAILKIQMKKIKKVIRSQIKNRKYVLSKIDKRKITCLISSPDISGETGMNIFLLLRSKEDADQAIAHARNKNIELRKLWDRPYYLHGVFQKAKLTPKFLGRDNCLVAEDISQRLISISIPPTLDEKRLNRIAREIRQLQKLKYIQ
ncbi:MAG: aminotransferase class I/II-fold pyridoxal phosphate-dependent enzyme [Candidatus Shapirobacteria bacterium]